MSNDLISLKEASKIAGCTPEHLNLMVRRKKLEGTKLGRNWYTTAQAVERYMCERKAEKKKTENILAVASQPVPVEEKKSFLEINRENIKVPREIKKEEIWIKEKRDEREEGEEIKIEKMGQGEKEEGEKMESGEGEEKNKKEETAQEPEWEMVGAGPAAEREKIKISRFKIFFPTLTFCAIIFFLMFPVVRYRIGSGEVLENNFGEINEPTIFNDSEGIVMGEETEASAELERGVVLASENYKLRQIRFGGEVIVRAEDDVKLAIENIRSETFMNKKQDESKAVITWSTNKGAICEINYSRNNGTDEKKLRENGFGYNHGIVIPDLDLDQAYVYQITAKDRWGNVEKSGNFAIYSGKKAVSVIEIITKELEKMFGWAKIK